MSPRPQSPANAVGGDLEERQGKHPAALFLRTVRRRAQGTVLGAGAIVSRWWGRRRPYRVLRIELGGDLPEVPPELRLRDLGRRRSSASDLLTLLATLRSAREDPELRMVVLDVHGLDAGWGTIQSVRRALLAVAAAGKPVWAYLTQPGTRDYYLASAASRVLLAPAGIFDVTGLASEVVFVKGALDKLGVEAQLARAGRFKAAAEPFTRTDMSPEHRAMAEALLDDLYDQLVGDVATARAMSAEAVRAAFTEGPLLAREAVRRGLVDEVAYPDEMRLAIKELCGDAPPIELAAYRRRQAWSARRAALDAPVVGVLAVVGPIGGETLPAAHDRPTSWRGFRRELEAMADDARVAGIVLRIDSPGGSGLSSDLMWREIIQARRRKPVLVSMGNVAASGGYYLAAAADHVTAEAATLTGSIGVLAGKPVLRGLYDHLGITKELVVRGNAGRHSDYVPLDDDNLAKLRGEAEAFYAEFVGKVAAGRGLTAAAVESVAEGRVWTGRQAIARGLVDTLGGIEEALGELKRRLAIPLESRLALVRRPRARSVWRSALARLAPHAALGDVLTMVEPVFRGERLLAVMPFLFRFVSDGAASGADEEAALAGGGADAIPRSGMRGIVRAAAESVAALLRPPLVF